ncbi:MAG: hypothetical protein PHQ34_09420 [Methanothrix sp.]|nr:hypothetical protein [Methanothrix sp.]
MNWPRISAFLLLLIVINPLMVSGFAALENGGIYHFKCMGHIDGNRWLDGVTQENRVWLAPTTTGGYTGTSWQAIEVEPGIYHLKCMGHIDGNRWLDGVTQENRVWLAPTTTGGYTGTSWQAIKVE